MCNTEEIEVELMERFIEKLAEKHIEEEDYESIKSRSSSSSMPLTSDKEEHYNLMMHCMDVKMKMHQEQRGIDKGLTEIGNSGENGNTSADSTKDGIEAITAVQEEERMEEILLKNASIKKEKERNSKT